MALPKAPEEREQGAVQEQEALVAAAPPPLEETPTQADAKTMEAVDAEVAAAVPPTEGAPAPTEPQTNMWRIPARYDKVLGQEHKSLLQQQEDIGYLWAALAVDPRVHPTVRYIAESLTGGRRSRGTRP